MRTLKLLVALTVAATVAACGSPNNDDSTADTLVPPPTGEVQDPPPAGASTSTSDAASGGPVLSTTTSSTSTTVPFGRPSTGSSGRGSTTASTGAASTTETTSATGTTDEEQPSTTSQESATTQPSGAAATTSPTTQTTPAQRAQTITFAAIVGPWAYGEPKTVVATASSGLPVGFDVAGACVVDNALLGVVRASDVGACSITVSQQGDRSWKPADPVTRSITISKATPVISGFTDSSYEHTRSPFTIPLTATATAGADVEYRTLPDDRGEAFCTLAGGQLQVPSTDILPRTCIIEAFVRESRHFEASGATARFAIMPTVVRFTGHSVVEVSDTSVTLSVALNRIWNISVYADCGSPPDLLEDRAQYTFSFVLAAPITAAAPCTIDVSTFSFDGSHTSDRLTINLP